MFSKSKRFQEPVSQAPPVGLYDVKVQTQVSAAAGFGKGKRFTELKDMSSCSTSSRNDSKCSQFASPLPFKKKRNNISTSTPDTKGKDHFKNNAAVETEVSELLSEKIELEDKLCQAQQDLQHMENKLQSTLQEKGSHESSIADLHRQLKESRQENDMLLEKYLQVITTTNNSIESLKEELTAVKQQLRDKDGVISSLKFELSCAAQSSRADLDLEQDRNRVLDERISHLEKTVSEVTQDRDEVEKANQQLHELVASLRRDNMDFRTKLDEAEEKQETEADSLRREVERAKAELEVAKEELTKNMEETGLAKACLRKALDEANNTIDNLIKREETLSQKLQLMESNQKKQEDEIKAFKAQLNGQIKSFEEKAVKSKEEFGRRLVETQKKLSQAEINFENFRSEQETKSKEKDMEMESRTSNDDQLNELKAQIEIWQTKYQDLVQKIEPCKDQLDEYEAERNALLCQNNQAKDEVAKLGQQYAKLLGHQNKKQKIHYVVKLKEENNSLKAEITKLREQTEKQMRAMKKLEEKLDLVSGKKKFNTTEAFSHSKKENMPLSVLSDGNGAF